MAGPTHLNGAQKMAAAAYQRVYADLAGFKSKFTVAEETIFKNAVEAKPSPFDQRDIAKSIIEKRGKC